VSSTDVSLPGAVGGTLSTFPRADGTNQAAYNGIPLYYWANDKEPGDTTGQNVGGVWFVVAPGTPFGAAPAPAASPVANAGTPAAAGEVDVTLAEFTVQVTETTFTVGVAYTFTATNAGGFTHEMVLEKAGDNDQPLELNGSATEIEGLAPSASGSLTVTFTEPGNYQLACHVMTHYPMGMALTIHVVA